jgi:hypothetical protein
MSSYASFYACTGIWKLASSIYHHREKHAHKSLDDIFAISVNSAISGAPLLIFSESRFAIALFGYLRAALLIWYPDSR